MVHFTSKLSEKMEYLGQKHVLPPKEAFLHPFQPKKFKIRKKNFFDFLTHWGWLTPPLWELKTWEPGRNSKIASVAPIILR